MVIFADLLTFVRTHLPGALAGGQDMQLLSKYPTHPPTPTPVFISENRSVSPRFTNQNQNLNSSCWEKGSPAQSAVKAVFAVQRAQWSRDNLWMREKKQPSNHLYCNYMKLFWEVEDIKEKKEIS